MSGAINRSSDPEFRSPADSSTFPAAPSPNQHEPAAKSAAANQRLHLPPTASPLQLFVRAKKRIIDIYAGITDYVQDAVLYVNKLPEDKKLITPDEATSVRSFVEKVSGIRSVLARDHMKVVFFGRTSNGKSSVINAMLRDKVLPSGMGHTTSCFLQVEGAEGSESYITVGSDQRHLSVQSLAQLGNALHKEKLDESSVVLIHWPKQRCHLLRDDVVLVDSPGIDVSQGLDDWIDTHCLDADVFVLVANAESTLMQTEKNFFHKVAARLSKPNVFILQNRWDQTSCEPEFMQVRQQHLERTVAFLADELRVMSRAEAEQRVFFVSAKECLLQRLSESRTPPANPVYMADGFQSRYFEFEEFERRFEECISHSAVSTKFKQHTQRAKSITSDLQQLMDAVYERTVQARTACNHRKRVLQQQLTNSSEQLQLVGEELSGQIEQLCDDVEQQVATGMYDEIRRLSVLVDEFDAVTFEPQRHTAMVAYKKRLHAYVESGLGDRLRERLAEAVTLGIEAQRRDIVERLTRLIAPDQRRKHTVIFKQLAPPRREPFNVLYRFNCDNLCGDFQEDISFKFTLGVTSVVNRLVGTTSNIFGNGGASSPHLPHGANTRDNSGALVGNARATDLALFGQIARASLASHGTVASLLVTGVVMSKVGWRLIGISAAIYGGLYLYERLTYTDAARLRRFKRQYVEHATRKLQLIVDLTSSNCSHQVEQELVSTLTRLRHVVQESIGEMNDQLQQVDEQLSQLLQLAAGAKTLRNKASYVSSQVGGFVDTFLSDMEQSTAAIEPE